MVVALDTGAMQTTPKEESENMNELHYNYELQVWIENGRVIPCGHADGADLCLACTCAGMTEVEAVEETRQHES